MPVVGSGTFRIRLMQLDNVTNPDGFVNWTPNDPVPNVTWTAIGLSGNGHSGGWSMSFFPGFSILELTGSGLGPGTYDIDNPPVGFTPTTNLKANPETEHNFIAPGGGESVLVQFGTETESASGPDFGIVSMPLMDLPDNTHYTGLVTSLFIVSGNVVGAPFTGGSVIQTTASPQITGDYEIVWYWWVLPETTTCGDKNGRSPTDSVSHLVLSADQPPTPDGAFGSFERLDPNDPDAAPHPVIFYLNPSAGQPGTIVQIIGDDFGDDATVKFDGVSATEVVVHSRYLISCKAPAHGGGNAVVTVINADGVSS